MSHALKRKPNRLANEKSPYLLQHKNNPVDWYPWSEEAFEKAKKEDKPIFLSIGYSTCHWCHVMERESFEDEEVAEALNKNYISIKVDREERPDIDSIYMSACQAFTGQGGWPLSIVMTYDKKPYFAATYIPKKSKYGITGIIPLLDKLHDVWKNDRNKVYKTSDQIGNYINENFFSNVTGEPNKTMIDEAFEYYEKNFDKEYGGFGDAPKFPSPHNLMFLLRYYKFYDSEKALEMVEKTLQSMYKGGIYDHIGFGFSRYSTDKIWLVPHFEKMLYDNALLAVVYKEAYEITKKEIYKKVLNEIFIYFVRDMFFSEGGFFSAEDADSEGIEGKYYIWNKKEILDILGKGKGEEFCKAYYMTEEGNFEGFNIPNLIDSNIDISYEFKKEKEKLFNAREKRIKPFKDDKILTSWNGLVLAALANGYNILKNEKIKNTAEKTVEFIFENLQDESGRLYARYRDGEVKNKAYADCYAYLIWGLIEMYQAFNCDNYLKKALELTKDMERLFWDNERGGYFQYGNDSEELIARPKEIYDGALPSANSVQCVNLLRLYNITEDDNIGKIAEDQLRAFSGSVEKFPAGSSYFLMGVCLNEKQFEIVKIFGNKNNKKVKDMIKVCSMGFHPNRIVINKGNMEEAKAQVCGNFKCSPDIYNVEELDKYLRS